MVSTLGFTVKFVKTKSIAEALLQTGNNLINNKIKKSSSLLMGSGITLTNNEIKGIIKVIRSLENRGILFKRTTRKNSSQEG